MPIKLEDATLRGGLSIRRIAGSRGLYLPNALPVCLSRLPKREEGSIAGDERTSETSGRGSRPRSFRASRSLARSLFRVLLQSNLRHFMGPIPTLLYPPSQHEKHKRGKDATVARLCEMTLNMKFVKPQFRTNGILLLYSKVMSNRCE